MSKNKQIQVLVAVTETVERKGLSSLLNSVPSLVVVGEAANGQEASVMAHESQPDVILIDDTIFNKGQSDPVQIIWRENNDIAVLVLCKSQDTISFSSEFNSERLCFIHKDTAPDELTRIIFQVLAGAGCGSTV